MPFLHWHHRYLPQVQAYAQVVQHLHKAALDSLVVAAGITAASGICAELGIH